MIDRNLSQRLARRGLRSVLGLPAPVLRRALGPAPENDRGRPLDLQTQALLRLMITGRQSPDVRGLRRTCVGIDL
jgi:hypothetical protein